MKKTEFSRSFPKLTCTRTSCLFVFICASNIYLILCSHNSHSCCLQVDHKKHLFAFGSKVEDDLLRGTSPRNKRFQDIFFYLFNWATVQSYKWKYGEGEVSDVTVFVLHNNLPSIIRYLSLFSSLTLIMLYFHLSNSFLFLSIVLSFCFWFLGENEDYFFFIKSKVLMDKSVFCTFITLTILLSDVLKSEVPFSTVLFQKEVSSLFIYFLF